MNLKNLKCDSCNSNTPKLSLKDINTHLKSINKWVLNEDQNMIFKKYTFKNFSKSLSFVNAVGKVAENEKHHPDISLGYGYCLIMIHTHAISSLSINDFILASKIDGINLES